MDQVYQALYGPAEDRLKYAGTVWLGLSLLANFGRADLGGFIGLIAILAALHRDLYLLRLFLIAAPLSLIVGLVYFWREDKSLAWVLLQLLHFVVQAVSVWWAWQWHQELTSQDGYGVPDNQPHDGARGQQTHADPFQAYVPPQSQQSNMYESQAQHNEAPQQNSQPPQRETGGNRTGENLL